MPRRVWMLCLTLAIVAFPKEGVTSGGGKIEITRDHVRLTVVTPHKIPMRGDEARYSREVDAWEKANRATVEKVALALEREVVAPYLAKKVPLASGRFDANDLGNLSSEGFARDGETATGGWRLTVELDPFPAGAAGARATFVLAQHPTNAVVRALARDAQHAVLRAIGQPVPPKAKYRAYWLLADPAAPSLLLSTLPLADLPAALQKGPWRPLGFESFRHAPLLVLATDKQKFLTRNRAGFLLANPTAARLEANGDLAVQVNGTFHPAAKVQKATKADAVRLLRSPVDPALTGTAAKSARTEVANDIDFLESLVPDVVD